MTDVSIIFVTAGGEEEAVKIGRTLVEERLVACANIIPRIRSIYRWKGEVFDEEEYLVIMKTKASLFPTVQERVRQLHSYETPEIVSFPIDQGLPDYLAWAVENTR